MDAAGHKVSAASRMELNIPSCGTRLHACRELQDFTLRHVLISTGLKQLNIYG